MTKDGREGKAEAKNCLFLRDKWRVWKTHTDDNSTQLLLFKYFNFPYRILDTFSGWKLAQCKFSRSSDFREHSFCANHDKLLKYGLKTRKFVENTGIVWLESNEASVAVQIYNASLHTTAAESAKITWMQHLFSMQQRNSQWEHKKDEMQMKMDAGDAPREQRFYLPEIIFMQCHSDILWIKRKHFVTEICQNLYLQINST